MKLFSLALSPYATRVRIAIYAKGLPVEILAPPADWRTSAEFKKLNPLVRIPVLILDDGTPLAESGVIVEYLEDAYPEVPLRPWAAKEAARVRFVTQVAEQYVMTAIMPLFGLFDAKAPDEPAIKAQLTKLEGTMKQLDDLLQPGAYAVGDRLTTADTWLTPLRYMLEGLMSFSGRKEILDERYPAILAYRDVILRDPHAGRAWQEMDQAYHAFMTSRSGKEVGG